MDPDGPGPRARGGVGQPLVWACDRDGGLVVRLDRELLVVDLVRMPRPTRVAPIPGGGAWVACALEGRPRGAHRVVGLDAALAEFARVETGPVLDLAVTAGGRAWVLEAPPGGVERVVGIAAAAPEVVLEMPGARALAAGDGWLAVGAETGRLELVDPEGRRTTVRLPGRVRALAPAPDGWWTAVEGDPGLLRLGRDGELLAAAPLAMTAPRLAAAPGGGLWVSDARGRRLERRGPAGEPLGLFEPNLAPRLGPLAVLEPEGVLIATPGALLSLDPDGALRRGQGGFERLVDLAILEPEAPRTPPRRRGRGPRR